METRAASWRTLLMANIGLVLAYVITGKLALLLALPPGYATPLFPPAGIALAAVVTGGARLLPGVLLGALLLNLLVPNPDGSAVSLLWILAALAAALASTVQAWAGMHLLPRVARAQLASARDVISFLLFAPAMCGVAATLALSAMLVLGVMSPGAAGANWITWWVGDTIGVLLAAPLCWILFGQPRKLWRRRRALVGVPLLLAAGAFIVIYEQVLHAEQARQLQTFRQKAEQAGALLQAQFNEHERFLRTLAKAFDTPALPAHEQFHLVASSYMAQGSGLLAMVWLTRVVDAERAQFERAASTPADGSYALRELGADRLRVAARRANYYPVLYVEPHSMAALRGFDFLSEPVRADALTRALASATPAASAPVTLVTSGRPGVVLLQAISSRADVGAPGAVLGMLLQFDLYLAHALGQTGFDGFAARVDDVTEPARVRVLHDDIGHPSYGDEYLHQLQLGGRNYQLRLAPTAAYLAKHHGWQSWTVLTSGLLLTGLLGALMLLVSGEREQIHSQVREGTATLREREARLQAILDTAGDAILTMDAHGTLETANPAAESLFGYAPGAMYGLALAQLLPLAGQEDTAALLHQLAAGKPFERELSGRKNDASSFPLSISVSQVALAGGALVVAILHDLSEQQRAQAHIYQLAHHDPLTGLENRFSLNLRLEQVIVQMRRARAQAAVLFIDLDHFKKINDTHGHQAGDALLTKVAHRLQQQLRDVDTIARLGGDEFVVVMAGALTPDSVTGVALRIVAALAEPVQLDGTVCHSGASVGVAMYPADGADVSTLLRHADTAMYAAKSQGRGNFQFFSAAMNAATHERLLLENRLWLALEQNEFALYLQPQVSLRDGAVIGAEALLRWHHPELGLIGPERIIPIAEECGLIVPLGEWVLARAVAQLAEWRRDGRGTLRLAVNLSARQCHGTTLLAQLDALLAASAIDPSRLELEITESAAMQDPQRTAALLRQLRQRGIQVAIDDFGTGYSSLSYLKLFALDRLKIDRSFVTDIETDSNDAVIVAATIALAHSLGLAVLAEGVESAAQRDFLRAKQCDEAQGFLFAHPMPAAQLRAWLDGAGAPLTGPARSAPGP